jgi:hypothetical protein
VNPILIGAKLALSDYGKPIHINSGIVSAMKYNKTSLLVLYYSIANVILKPIARHKERKRKEQAFLQSILDRQRNDFTLQFETQLKQVTINWKHTKDGKRVVTKIT